VLTLNGIAVASFADAQYALHRAPWKGTVPITWTRDGKTFNGELTVVEGWKKTNPTWRPSMLDILPSLPFSGRDLDVQEKKAQGLPAERLAFLQEKPVHRELQAAGVRDNDVIVGIDDQPLAMTMKEFLGHVRRNYLVGERIKLNILRGGQRVDVPLTLR
jgi:S1-C subfamily serine protease